MLAEAGDEGGAEAAKGSGAPSPTPGSRSRPASTTSTPSHRALAADHDDARALGYLGCWLLDAGRTLDAIAALERAIDAGTEDPVVWRNAAVGLVNAGGDAIEADRRYAARPCAEPRRSSARL